MRGTIIAAAAGLSVLAGCVAPRPPQPEIFVYTGGKDPRYALPERFRTEHRQQNEQRMLAAVRFQQHGEALLRRMQSDPHFGGMVFRHQPEPHAIVMFTGDARARLSRYTADPRFRPVRVALTLAELERQKGEMAAALARHGIACVMVDADEEHNRVTVATPQVEVVRRLIAERRISPPPRFELVTGGCAQLR